jgi:succinyl-CoA synthetase beta subunit
MKIHEYQARDMFRKYNIPVTARFLIEDKSQIKLAVENVFNEGGKGCVVKAQIHAGGRGNGGGVKLAKTKEDALQLIDKIFGMTLKTHQTKPAGQLVRKVLLTPLVDMAKQYYVAITLDRKAGKNVVMCISEGGVDVETIAVEKPEKIVKEWVEPGGQLTQLQARNLASAIGLDGAAFEQGVNLFINLYKLYVQEDATLVEINPMIKTDTGDILALDAKVNFDDDAVYRHKDHLELRDIYEEDPVEVEAKEIGLNYLKLAGNIGCMVNGAGLAMATMDIIKLMGGEPANFLDVGGRASSETISKGFNIILKDENVKAILVNIFGGIVRCDRVANGILLAAKAMTKRVPIVVRFSGTNSEEANEILASSDFDIILANNLSEAAEKVVYYGNSN